MMIDKFVKYEHVVEYKHVAEREHVVEHNVVENTNILALAPYAAAYRQWGGSCARALPPHVLSKTYMLLKDEHSVNRRTYC